MYRHRLAQPVAATVFVVLVVVALLSGAHQRSELKDTQDQLVATQQRVVDTQQDLVDTQAGLEQEILDRIDAVCQTAVDNRTITDQVVTLLTELDAPVSSELREVDAQVALRRILRSKPPQCEPAG